MAQKIVGYREMNWTCPNCGTINPGSQRNCKACGQAMGQEVKFDQSANAQVIKDEAVIEKAKKGPDIYCAYCGNRNPAGSKNCTRCGADLSEGVERSHGQQYVEQKRSPEAAPLICPACGSENPANALKCKNCGNTLSTGSVETIERQKETPVTPAKGKGCGKPGCLFIIIAIVVIALIGGAIGLFGGSGDKPAPAPAIVEPSGSNNQVYDFNTPTEAPVMGVSGVAGVSGVSGVSGAGSSSGSSSKSNTINAQVTKMNWETTGTVMGYIDTTGHDWYDEIPSGASNVSCSSKLRYTFDEEEDARGKETKEVCGDVYTVDLGNGYEALAQDCVYEVYEDYCSYTTSKWGTIGQRSNSGSGKNVQLPVIDSDQQFSDTRESYTITLRGEDGKTYTINPDKFDYASCSVGDTYVLTLNDWGKVTGARKN